MSDKHQAIADLTYMEQGAMEHVLICAESWTRAVGCDGHTDGLRMPEEVRLFEAVTRMTSIRDAARTVGKAATT